VGALVPAPRAIPSGIQRQRRKQTKKGQTAKETDGEKLTAYPMGIFQFFLGNFPIFRPEDFPFFGPKTRWAHA
jgi:hypothetical protein